MATLMHVSRDEIKNMKIRRRQLPIQNENLMMLMDLSTKGLVFDHPVVQGRDLDEFVKKYRSLTADELKISLKVTINEFTSVLSQSVPCVGCRRSVERLFFQLMLSGHPTLEPLIITKKGVLTINDEKLKSPQIICTLLHKHQSLLNSLLENQSRSKKSSRCCLHSLDSFRTKPFSEIWLDVWNSMKETCRNEVTIVEAQELQNTLDGYLKKHKFCQECRTKVEKAYTLLVNENNSVKEKGYVSALYSNINRCLANKHIHLKINTEFIDSLIKRAEPELNGSNSRHRERHAKTLEIAQEEVLTCVGMCIYERLRRIHMCLKEEENACQVLAAVSVHALCRNFDMAVEKKRGKSNLELLYEEMNREEQMKEYRKEQKKLKKRKKRNEKKNIPNLFHNYKPDDDEPIPDKCDCSSIDEADDEDDNCLCDDEHEEINRISDIVPNLLCCQDSLVNSKDEEVSVISCHSCENNKHNQKKINNSGRSKAYIDGGYSSESHGGSCSATVSSSLSSPNSRTSSLISSSPEGSEIACSEEYCNHNPNHSQSKKIECKSGSSHGATGLTLQQMLENVSSDDENDSMSYIPEQMIIEFKSRNNNIKKEREELRQKLLQNFNQLCINQRLGQKYNDNNN